MNLYSTQFLFLSSTCEWKFFKLEKNFDSNGENVWNLNIKLGTKSNVFHSGDFDVDSNIFDVPTNYHCGHFTGNRL